jgi:hypothetical protein
MSDPYKRNMRKGRWKVARDILLDVRYHRFVKAVQDEVIIIGTDYDIMTDIVNFQGLSEHFEIVPEGNVIPQYVPIAEGRKIRWEKVDQ